MLLSSIEEIPRAHRRALNPRRRFPARSARSGSSSCERHRHRRPTERMCFLSIEPKSRMPTHRRPPWCERPGLLLSRPPETHRAANPRSSAFTLATVTVPVPKFGLHPRPCAATLLLLFSRALTLLLLSGIRAGFHYARPAWYSVRCAHSLRRRERGFDGPHSRTLGRLV